jgi:hypothetical protein
MFKLVVLSALLAVAAAGVISPVSYAVHETPVIAKVGEIVENVPTAVSHQSSTVVHSRAAVSTPVVAPVVTKTVVAATPIVAKTVVAAPAEVAYGSPLSYTAHTVPLAGKTVVAAGPAPYVYSGPVAYSSPVAYSAPVAYASAPVAYASAPVAYSSAPVAYASAPVVETKTVVEAPKTSISKTYVAEPDSVRYTEQVQNHPSEVVVEKSVYAAPAVKYVQTPVAYHAVPSVHAW